eukprot:6927748-Prymnesium_polylepis.1
MVRVIDRTSSASLAAAARRQSIGAGGLPSWRRGTWIASKDGDLDIAALVKEAARRDAQADLDNTRTRTFKTFVLFPLLVKLQFVDHIARVLYPLVFGIVILIMFAEVHLEP